VIEHRFDFGRAFDQIDHAGEIKLDFHAFDFDFAGGLQVNRAGQRKIRMVRLSGLTSTECASADWSMNFNFPDSMLALETSRANADDLSGAEGPPAWEGGLGLVKLEKLKVFPSA